MRKFCILAGLILFCHCSLPGKELVLENKHAAFHFSAENNYALSAIVNKATGRTVAMKMPRRGEGGLWRVRLLNDKGQTSLVYPSGPVESTIKNGHAEFLWKNRQLNGQQLNIRVTVSLPEDSGLARWNIEAEVSGKPADWIWSLDFPTLANIQSLGDDALLFPNIYGRIIRNPALRQFWGTSTHPGWCGMQFMAFYGSEQHKNLQYQEPSGRWMDGTHRGPADDETGLYISCDDPDHWRKEINAHGQNSTDAFTLELKHSPSFPYWPRDPARDAGKFTYRVPYDIKLGTFAGGAGKAVEIYRDEIKDRDFMARGPMRKPATGDGISPKLLASPLWRLTWDNPAESLQRVIDYYRMPMVFHRYGYTQNWFDYNFADFFPVVPFFREEQTILKRMGMISMPYTNSISWDTNTPSYARLGMDESATIAPDGIPTSRKHSTHYWSTMDPAHVKWPLEYNKLLERLIGTSNAGALYLDEGGQSNQACYAADKHPAHGGSYWTTGYRDMLKNMGRTAKKLYPEAFLTTETFTEDYIDLIDSYMIENPFQPSMWARNYDGFPLVSHVYHDYTTATLLDRPSMAEPIERLRLNYGLAYTWGMAIQAVAPGRNQKLDASPHAAFIRNLVQSAYRVGSRYLTGGKMAEVAVVADRSLIGKVPAAVIAPAYELKNFWGMPWKGTAVPASGWYDVSSHDFALTMVNVSGKEQQAEIRFFPEYLKTGNRQVWQTWPLPARKIGTLKDGTTPFFVTVPADDCAIVEVLENGPSEPRPLLDRRDEILHADKTFPTPVKKGNELYGADYSIVENSLKNNANTLTLLSPQTSRARQIEKNNHYFRNGIERKLENLNFDRIYPVGVTFAGEGKAAITSAGKVSFGELEVVKGGILSAGPGNILAVSPAGKIIQGEQPLHPGKWRILAYSPEVEASVPQTIRELAALSEQALKNAMALFESGIPPYAEREKAEELFALGNGMAFLATGKQLAAPVEYNWLIPEVPLALKGNVASLLNNFAVETEKRDDHSVLTVPHQAYGYTLPFIAMERLEANGSEFTLTALFDLEVAEPLLVEVERDARYAFRENDGVFRTSLRIQNFAPYDLKLGFEAELPEKWSIVQSETPPEFIVPGYTEIYLPVSIRNDSGKPARYQEIPVHVSYGERNKVKNRDYVVAVEKALAVPYTKNDQVISDITVGPQEGIFGAFSVLVGEDRKLNFGISGTNHIEILDENGNRLEFNHAAGENIVYEVPAPGVYTVRYGGGNTRTTVRNSTAYGYHAGIDLPFSPGPDALKGMKPYYFLVEKGAKYFEMSIGKTPYWPVAIPLFTFIRPDGEKAGATVTRQSMLTGNWYRVEVPKGMDGKLWSISFDGGVLQLMLGEGAVPFISPVREGAMSLSRKQPVPRPESSVTFDYRVSSESVSKMHIGNISGWKVLSKGVDRVGKSIVLTRETEQPLSGKAIFSYDAMYKTSVPYGPTTYPYLQWLEKTPDGHWRWQTTGQHNIWPGADWKTIEIPVQLTGECRNFMIGIHIERKGEYSFRNFKLVPAK